MIGIAASPASIPSLERLLAHLPAGLNAAAVVSVEQQDQLDAGRLREALGRATAWPVQPAVEGHALVAGTVHLLPADRVLALRDGRLAVSEERQEHGRADSFLVSLAEEMGENGIGIVLTEMASAGTLGMVALKERGGLTLAEAPESGRPQQAAGAAGLVDFLLPAEAMGARIAAHLQHLAKLATTPVPTEPDESETTQIVAIADVLRDRTGHDFHDYKPGTFLRRVRRRMQVTQSDAVDAYIARLRADPDEVGHLFQDLLIGVTRFFRDAPEFALVEREVIPRMLAGRGAGDHVRVWVLGCATGEEAYSIAILLREAMMALGVMPQVQIFATDIDGRALAAARVGRYTESIARDVPPERLARWFVREGNTYCVVKELREMCIFSAHNVIKDAPFSRIDLISCRNLLIYLNLELQDRLFPLFHFALQPGGVLFLGPSETVTQHVRLFAPIDRRHRLFRRQDGAGRVVPDFPLTANGERRRFAFGTPAQPQAAWSAPRPESRFARQAERIAERYAPAYVVIDANYDVLHFSGRTGRYLEPSSGAANLNLLQLVHRDLRLELRALLSAAVGERKAVRAEGLELGQEDGQRLVNLAIEPVVSAGAPAEGETSMFVVLFQDAGRLPTAGERAAPLRDELVTRLETELQLGRGRLQASIEQLESANEELKSSNEEYLSINEELQSANEELETSKEELQSVNEELHTVNGELADRASELVRANSDIKNLLEGTQIATIFLDNELRVRIFTRSATEIFHLLDRDEGRPISHIAQRVAYPELEADVRRVLRTLATVEREVAGETGETRYFVRVLPYRSIDNFIAGVVLTFLDVSATVRAELALSDSDRRLRIMAQAMFTATPDTGWDYVNAPFADYTGISQADALGDGWRAALHPGDREADLALWATAGVTGEGFEQELRLRSAAGEYRWFLCRVEAMRTGDGEVERWFGSLTDIHERQLAASRQKLLLAELQHRVKNILAVVRSIARRTRGSAASPEEEAAHFDARLDALGRTQNVLARTTDAGADLEELVREELLSHAAREGEQVTISGPPVRLRQRAAEAVGLALHELATNAVKYGALSASQGRLAMQWGVDRARTNPCLVLEWRETGVADVEPSPARHGFGRELIERGLPYELGARTRLEFLPGGVRCVVEIPLTELVAAGAAGPGPSGAGDGWHAEGPG